MLDPRLLKENPEAVHDMLKKNMTDFPIDELIILHKRRGDVITKTQNSTAKNLLSETCKQKRSKEDASLELENEASKHATS